MYTSNSAPMIGARTPNSGYKPWTNGRQDKPAPWRPGEVRASKIAERDNLAVEIAEELDWFADNDLAGSFDLPRSSTFADDYDESCYADDDLWLLERLYDELDRETGDRAAYAAAQRAERLSVLDLADDPDYPGWGRVLTFDDLHVYRLSDRPF